MARLTLARKITVITLIVSEKRSQLRRQSFEVGDGLRSS
jgi:hypothetical protein